jgi:hypothetical protein
VDKKGETVG